MNRRAFLGALLGTGAAVATEAVAPSLVWPFRKYFLPSNWKRWIGYDWAGNLVGGDFGAISPGSVVATQGFTHINNNGIYTVIDDDLQTVLWEKPIPDLRLAEEYVEAIELEAFAKEIPDLLNKGRTFYEFFKRSASRFDGIDYYAPGLPSPGTYRGLNRSKYPGRMRVPIRAYAVSEKDQKCADAVNQLLEMKNGNSIEVPFRVLPEERQNQLLARAGIFPEAKQLLHKKATVENIVRFVDELQSKG